MEEKREITLENIKEAYERISPHIQKTPVLESKIINQEHGRRYFFKCENMQTTGSFKIRGAINATMQYLKSCSGNIKGLVTHSSGNHGLAVAMAAMTFGVKCAIVAPKTTAQYKLDSIKRLKAELVLCEQTMESRIQVCHDIQTQRGYHYISSCDDYDVITGQATIALEFLDQVPDLDAILVTISGGGMAAGSCLTTKFLNPHCKVFTAEPPGKFLEKCLNAEQRLWPNPPQYLDTVAEGLRVQQVGHRDWPILLDNLQRQVITVSDEDSIRGLQYAFKNLKVVLETSAGTAVAGALSPKLKQIEGLNKIGVVLCGGNVDIDKLPFYLEGVNDVTFA